jgi:hypothetical protein
VHSPLSSSSTTRGSSVLPKTVYVYSLTSRSSSLTPENAAELLEVLIGRYIDTLRSGTSPLVARKLASALATFFLSFHQVWGTFCHHLVLCLVSGQSCRPSALHNAPDSSSLIDRMNPSQLQPALWVLRNVLEEATKINLNSPKKFVLPCSLEYVC